MNLIKSFKISLEQQKKSKESACKYLQSMRKHICWKNLIMQIF